MEISVITMVKQPLTLVHSDLANSMMKSSAIATLLLVSVSFCGPVQASIIFQFGGGGAQGAALDNLASGMVTVSGITATVSANSGTLNQGTSNFGINSAGTNETTRIDDDTFDEVLTISFSEIVFLNSFETSGGNSATDGSYTIAGGAPVAFSQISGGGAVTTSMGGAQLNVGQTFTIQQDAGAEGFSFNQINVSAVPEPSSLAMLAVAGTAATIRYRRRKRDRGSDPSSED